MKLAAVAAILSLALLVAGSALGGRRADGWKTYRIKAAGISLELPTTWVPAAYENFTPQPGSLMAKKYPGMTEMARLALKNKLVKFFAFAQAGEPVDIVVIRLGGGGQGMSNGLAAQLTSAAIQAGIRPSQIHERTVSLPAGRSTLVTLPLSIMGLKLEASEYILSHDGSVVDITLGAPVAQLGRYEPVFDRIAQSVRFL